MFLKLLELIMNLSPDQIGKGKHSLIKNPVFIKDSGNIEIRVWRSRGAAFNNRQTESQEVMRDLLYIEVTHKKL